MRCSSPRAVSANHMGGSPASHGWDVPPSQIPCRRRWKRAISVRDKPFRDARHILLFVRYLDRRPRRRQCCKSNYSANFVPESSPTLRRELERDLFFALEEILPPKVEDRVDFLTPKPSPRSSRRRSATIEWFRLLPVFALDRNRGTKTRNIQRRASLRR